jgi:glycosyltransferase involved in cell wall biosynthesis
MGSILSSNNSVDPLVSVVIPVFNSEKFIYETLNAVICQDYKNLEILIVNDGSNDDSESEISKISDPRIKYFYNENKGVSTARNFGLSKANGEFVLFLDSDDLLPPAFIRKRAAVLIEFPFFGFACGYVQRIDSSSVKMDGLLSAACNEIQVEVLGFNAEIVTCPSSYLFRKSDLINADLYFNLLLSSSADRLYLLEVDKYLKGHFVRDLDATLLYRVSTNSLSNNLNEKLILDNEHFYELALSNLSIDKKFRSIFLSKSNYVLAGAYFKIGKIIPAFKFAFLSLAYGPMNFFRTFFKIKNDEF